MFYSGRRSSVIFLASWFPAHPWHTLLSTPTTIYPGISGPARVQALVASIITAGSIVTKGKQCSAEYAQLAEQHAGECAKTFEEYVADMERYKILRDVGETGLPQKGDEREDTGLYFRY
ncbi:hypothetical protein PInf_018075 [Phytophthora infestans]|nr:hypothetical protein PInf_018075 [Phytophthora infestans]